MVLFEVKVEVYIPECLKSSKKYINEVLKSFTGHVSKETTNVVFLDKVVKKLVADFEYSWLN